MSAHAILSPSGASRWLSCTPSARLEERFPDSAGDAAKEGTLAHELGELLIRQKLALITPSFFEEKLQEIQDSRFYDKAMLDHSDDYALFVIENFNEAKSHTSDALLFLEQKLDLTDYVPEGFGTGDAIIIANGVLDINDLKYGKGVPVSSEQNKQMMLYALGALKEFDFLFDIHTVRMTIFQPRLDSVSTWEIPVQDLRKWAEEELIPKAALAFNGEGDYNPGAHCRFCRARAICKANADMHLQVAKYDFKSQDLLTEEEVADVLSRADVFKNWISSVEEYALNEAVNNGVKWPGFKLVEGRSNRKYEDESKVAIKLTAEGYKEEVIYEKQLLGITKMEKIVGKAKFSVLLSDLIIKPPGKPTLVPETDKRPAFNSTESAVNDFQNA